MTRTQKLFTFASAVSSTSLLIAAVFGTVNHLTALANVAAMA